MILFIASNVAQKPATDDWNDSPSGGNDGWGNDNQNGWGNSNGRSNSGFREGVGSGQRRPFTCHVCNEEGHKAMNCPQKSTRPRGPMKCFKCQQEGHRANECPQSGSSNGTTNCGDEWGSSGGNDDWGTTNSGSNDRRPMTCNYCKEEGHKIVDCPKKKRPSNRGADGGDEWGSSAGNDWGTGGVTDNGDDWGTGGATNTDGNERRPRGPMRCFKCQEEGHRANECTKETNGDGQRSSRTACHRCNKEGHKATDCTEDVFDADGKPKPPPYRPPELNEDDESLYSAIPTGINFDKYDKIKVNVSGEDPPRPIQSFEEGLQSELLKEAIQKCKYTIPTPIQKYAIPMIAAGRDLMGCAQTGSGKTAAFILPILQSMFNMKDLQSMQGLQPQEPICIVISPTRELAIQIHTEAVKFAKGSIIKPQLIYGGTQSGYQKIQIQRGAHLLVATPGRLLDFVDKELVSFAKLKFLVLDEADRMIDQGFLPEIRRMLDNELMPDKSARQTLMFSATFPEEVQRMARDFLKPDYLFITVGVIGAANSDVEQKFLQVQGKEKRSKLMEILSEDGVENRILIFVEKKKTADFLASFISQTYKMTTSIHGDRYQQQREQALYDFRSGRMPILVATSVAARGLDIKDVKHVINYDLPKEIDEYVHRIGRTGRVGNLGKATSFFDPDNPQDALLAPSLLQIMKQADQVVPEFLSDFVEKKGSFGADDFGGDNFTSADIRTVSLP